MFSLFDHFFCVSALRERNKAVKIVVFDSTQGRKVHGSSRKEWGGEGICMVGLRIVILQLLGFLPYFLLSPF